MAEIVRSRTETMTSTTTGAAPQAKTFERVVVRSIRSNRLDVSVLRDLVKALDEAAMPGAAFVTAHHSEVGHLVQLVVERTEDLAE